MTSLHLSVIVGYLYQRVLRIIVLSPSLIGVIWSHRGISAARFLSHTRFSPRVDAVAVSPTSMVARAAPTSLVNSIEQCSSCRTSRETRFREQKVELFQAEGTFFLTIWRVGNPRRIIHRSE